jgi:NAD(P)-dependent dehydrogenase (short-subunit alcohol dehydrogenase family)
VSEAGGIGPVLASELNGRGAIVTGAASEIGTAIAMALAEHGAQLVLIGRHVEAMRPIASEIRDRGGRAHVISCDLTQGDQVTRMIAEARGVFEDRIDILVNAAGGTGGLAVPIWDTSETDFSRVLSMNLTASFLTMAAVLPVMMAHRHGRIINIGGTYGMRGRAGRTAYSAAKWGLRGLTKSAALEVGPFNITVNCVSPGMVEGRRFDEAAAETASRDSISPARAKERIAGGSALHRVSAPADIANMVRFLAGEAARQITGQDLVVDGGWAI